MGGHRVLFVGKNIISFFHYRQTSLQIACFLLIEGLWQPCVEQVYFSNSIFSLGVSVSHFGNSHNIANFSLLYSSQWSVISDLWCYYCYCFGASHTVPYQTVNLIHKCCVCSDCSLSLSQGLLIPWDTTILKFGQLIALQWPLSVQVKGRVTHLHFKSKARRD